MLTLTNVGPTLKSHVQPDKAISQHQRGKPLRTELPGLLQHKPHQALAQVSPAPLLAFLGTIMKNNGHLGQKPSNHHRKKPLPSPQLSLSPPSTPPANMTFRTQVGGRWVATMPELQVATGTFCHSTEKNQNDQRTRMSPVSRKLSF